MADLVPLANVTLLAGDGGAGKSLLALQLAVACAAGRHWLGSQAAPGPALYLSAEDDRDELHRRLVDIAAAEGVSLGDLDKLHLLPLAGQDAVLARPEVGGHHLEPTPLMARLEAAVDRLRPRLVVIDTLADAFGGNENDRGHARQFIGMLRGWAIRHGCAVLVLAHPSLTGLATGTGASGSTAWGNSVRSRLHLSRIVRSHKEPDPDARRLTVNKANHARAGQSIGLRWTNGAFVLDGAAEKLDREPTGAEADRVFLKLLRRFTEQGRHVSDKPSANYAPSRFAEHPEADGMTKAALRDAMNRLLSAGSIWVREVGQPSRRTRMLAEVTEVAT